eukprot:SAG31_NODE_38605_length_295_cov_0.622449_1_plen_65_part_01
MLSTESTLDEKTTQAAAKNQKRDKGKDLAFKKMSKAYLGLAAGSRRNRKPKVHPETSALTDTSTM